MAANFINKEGAKIHDALGGSSRLDDQRASFVQPLHYEKLDALLTEYVSVKFNIVVSDSSWDVIYDKIIEGENELQKTDKDIKQLFNKVVLKMGDNAEIIQPFVDLIPNEFGLSVVKAGIAIILKYAARESEKRTKIYDAFSEVRDTIADARSFRKSFFTDTDVSRCAADLYDAVVKAVEDLFQYVPVEVPADAKGQKILRLFPQLHRRREKIPDLDTVLTKMKDKAKNLRRCAEGRTHERVGETLVKVTNLQSSVKQVRHGLNKTYVATLKSKKETSIVKTKVTSIEHHMQKMSQEQEEHERRTDQKYEEILRNINEIIIEKSLDAKNGMVQAFNNNLNEKRADAEMRRKWRAVAAPVVAVTPDQLLDMLVQRVGDLDALLLHSSHDLRSIVMSQDQFDAVVQAQAQSLLQNRRFVEWLQSSHSDLLLADGNSSHMPVSGGISALSLLCATLAASMATTHTDDLVLTFFCGLHCASQDPLFGPLGLLRSLIVQVLQFLVQNDRVLHDSSTRIEKPGAYLEGFLSSFPDVVGDVLHRLLQHIHFADVSVYCIVDFVSCFDKELHNQLNDLKVVFSSLQAMTGEEGNLTVPFKVILTNPGRSTRRLSSLVDPSQHLTLLQSHGDAQPISERSVQHYIASLEEDRVGEYGEDEWD